MGIILCAVGFMSCLLLGRMSLSAGLGALLTVGYLYGIIRANYLDSFSYVLFDVSVLGLYLSHLPQFLAERDDARIRALRQWLIVLLGWVAIVFLLPMQPLMIRLVGLRGNGFLLPFLWLGAQLRREEALRLALYVAALNLVALAFGAGEFLLGIERFFPRNVATNIIYASHDVAGQIHRIPACFANAHVYGGTMAATLPWLIGAWVQPFRQPWQRWLVIAGIASAMLGVFLCAARTPAALLFLQMVLVTWYLRGALNFAWLGMIAAIAYVVSNEERLQRFLTLGDTKAVAGRIEGSVNASFWELLVRFPMGNGLGGGGTSLPSFVENTVEPVGMENEYTRILLEQGVVGLVLWIAFLIWAFTRFPDGPNEPWRPCRRLLWWTCLATFANGMLGTGLMTAIPQTVITFLGVGFIAVKLPQPEYVTRWRTSREAAPVS